MSEEKIINDNEILEVMKDTYESTLETDELIFNKVKKELKKKT